MIKIIRAITDIIECNQWSHYFVLLFRLALSICADDGWCWLLVVGCRCIVPLGGGDGGGTEGAICPLSLYVVK